MRSLFKNIISTLLLLLLTSALLQAQQEGGTPLQGRVLSASTGNPIAEVQIDFAGADSSMYASSEGQFELFLPREGAMVSFTHPNFVSKQIFVSAGDQDLEIFMIRESDQSVDRSTYSGKSFRFLTSAYHDIDRGELEHAHSVSPEATMQGRLPGVSVNNVSGMPGEGGVMNIRGYTSLFASGQPLVLVDGVPFDADFHERDLIPGTFTNPLKALDAYDIKRIEVVKDGSSIYGLRGGNGVIHITTRRSENVSTKINFAAHSGMSFAPDYIPMMDAPESKAYIVSQLQNTGRTFTRLQQEHPWISGNPSYYQYYNFANNTQWQDEVFEASSVNKVNASLSGGDEIAKYYVSLGYLNHEGVVKNTGYQRYNMRFNSDVNILPQLTMHTNVGFVYSVADLKNFGNNTNVNPIYAGLLKSPMYAPRLRDNQGNEIAVLSDVDAFGFSNPTAVIQNAESSVYDSRLFANTRLKYELNNTWEATSMINVHYSNSRISNFLPDYGLDEFNNGEYKNKAGNGIDKMYIRVNATRLQYNNVVDQVHFWDGFVGARFQMKDWESDMGTVYDTPTDEFKSLSSVTSIEDTYINGTNRSINYASLYGRLNYRFRDKYLLTMDLNLSSSSNIGQQADGLEFLSGIWGFFPSVKAGWLISSEPFMKSAHWMDMLKLRASFSRTGNDFYSDQSRYGYTSSTYDQNSGLVRSFMPNRSLKWETIDQANIGADLAIFKEAVQLSADVFTRTTHDLLTYNQLPVEMGYSNYWENNGTLKVSGVDLGLDARVIDQTFTFDLGLSLAFIDSELNLDHDMIVDVPGGQVVADADGEFLSFYGHESMGVFQTMAQAEEAGLMTGDEQEFIGGDVHFRDTDGDQVIDQQDKLELGQIMPTFQGGVSASLGYKNLSLDVLFDFNYGNKVFNYTRMLTERASGFGNQTEAVLNAWKHDGDQTDIPRIAYGDPKGNARFSDRWIEDGSYIRLKNIKLSYTFEGNQLYKDIQVYLAGSNLLTFTNYLGYTPEFSYSNNPLMQGIDYGQMPIPQSVVLGVNVGF